MASGPGRSTWRATATGTHTRCTRATARLRLPRRCHGPAFDHRYYYARFDGTVWEVHVLAHAGSTLLSAGEPFYTGLAALLRTIRASGHLHRKRPGHWDSTHKPQ